jgi:hypothetical protein
LYLRFRLELLINLSMNSLPHQTLLFLILFVTCQNPKSISADTIIENSIAAYGFDSKAHSIDFDFRDYHYSLKRDGDYFSYLREIVKEDIKIVDIMTSDKMLQRYENNILVSLQDSIQNVYSNSLNSVMYFFQLPKPLLDPAAKVLLIENKEISGALYWTLKVTFNQEGGGDDFQDEFRYWINQDNYQIDFMAYNYLTDGGGTRFRKAINKRKIKGFLFQDYINYKSREKFANLDSLPVLFQQGELNELSLIENKNILLNSQE